MNRTAVARRCLALLGALPLVACGSTVQVQGHSTLDQGGYGIDQATGTPALNGSTAPGASQSLSQTTGASVTTPGSVQASGGGSAGAGVTPTQVPGALVGPGITPTTIFLGLQYTKDAASGAAAIGAAGASPGDLRVYYNAVINDINKHGGVAHRKLSPIYYGIDTQASGGISSEDSASCALWTQDHKVFLMSGGRESLNSCAEKHGGVSMAYGNETLDTFRRYPHYLDPISFRLERIGALTVESLSQRHYFTGKFGLVTWDDPNYRKAVRDGYEPALKRAGVTPTRVFYAPVPQAYGDLGSANAAISSAVLDFQTRGIDHVIVQDGPAGLFSGTGLTLQWLNASESQQYHPRYGMNSYNSPGSQALPATQQANMLFVNWSDSTTTSDTGWKTNATRESCFTTMRNAGITLTSQNQFVAAVICDSLYLFKRVGDRLTSFTSDAFIAAAEKVGGYPTASVYGASLHPGKHDGGDLVRDGHYETACACPKFDSKPYSPTW
jgi:hypothetical protein